jgi:hypothetical protein
VLDTLHALDVDPRLEWLPAAALRDSVLLNATLLFENADALADPERAEPRRRLERELRRAQPPPLLSGTSRRRPLDLPGLLAVPLALPDVRTRAERWRTALATHGVTADDGMVVDLAETFRLGSAAIESAARRAASAARLAAASADRRSVFAAAAAESSDRIGDVARRLEPRRSWPDLILPPDRIEQLRDLCTVVRHRDLVYRRWGFADRVVTGTGVTVLFAGPSGTGKTLAAEVVAGAVGLDAYVMDISTIVSKYIGETEKNLARVFEAAESANAILFFDEADALFGKRTEVRDSHDRYANVEVSYLLQRIESFDGVVVLATNLRKNMDEAFVRRLQFTIDFPFPDERDRRRIWDVVWPPATPLADDCDLDELARRYDLAGGNIRNIAVAAAFLAAGDGQVVTMSHLLRATRREYGKLGKIVEEREFIA